MNNSDLISVIVPVYNVQDYLDKCIQSIQKQEYSNIEIILVDDGSTDSSGIICDQYAEKDTRIKVIHKANGGLSDARNAGIEMSTGRWISFIDSDDYISENFLEDLLAAAINNECQMSVCNMVRVYENGTTEKFYSPVDKVVVLDETEKYSTLNQPSVCNKLFQSDLFDDVRFPVGKYYEDTFVYHILAHKAKKIVLTGNEGYFYLLRSGSILGQQHFTERYFDYVEAIYNRMIYLMEQEEYFVISGPCLSLYAAVATAEKNIQKTKQNNMKFKQMRKWYNAAYKYLIHCNDIGVKQKIRLVLLKYFPKLHSRIY